MPVTFESITIDLRPRSSKNLSLFVVNPQKQALILQHPHQIPLKWFQQDKGSATTMESTPISTSFFNIPVVCPVPFRSKLAPSHELWNSARVPSYTVLVGRTQSVPLYPKLGGVPRLLLPVPYNHKIREPAMKIEYIFLFLGQKFLEAVDMSWGWDEKLHDFPSWFQLW